MAHLRTITLECPDEVLISLKASAEEFTQELKMLGAVKLFELGKLSSGRAAQLAGLSRVEFLLALGRYQVSPFHFTAKELDSDVSNA